MHRTSPVTQVVAIGIGAALFFVLGRFVAVPSPVPNTSIALQYGVLAVFAVLYGPWVGALAGFIGHLLVDATGFGIWLSWEFATGVFGLVVGLLMLRHAIHEGEFGGRTIGRFLGAVVVAHALAWLVIAPLGDILIYAEPAGKVFTQGAVAFVANTLTTGVIGTLLLLAYSRTRTRTGSLTVDR
ncbi:ECF-type riboflavin transporter substrate-binding protein [Brachybacterium sp. EF45031]|uniref:ECF-type riboflavin transporter substrate-binding protein n=1 Tax=Brachybacterium sillae TaxID=2810536 RepID=UPI00217E18EA|nr:ECF-type riboflavin transporter substrate-binding protein [Brachybacterium sillae]MCS6711428.1 ECF-type riboflavin transporter substrate-binding protein [Brachybacterium sillae]